MQPLRADDWPGRQGGDVEVRGEDFTSVILRPHHPLILVMPALHGCWPDRAALTPGQARRLAAALVEMADGIEPGGAARRPRRKPAPVVGARGLGVIASHDAALADEEHRRLRTAAVPNGIAGALLDAEAEGGLALNGPTPAQDAKLSMLEPPPKPARKRKAVGP